MYISVVTPVYKAEEILPELYRRLIESLSKITDDFEIIMVNDGSPGNDWEVIKLLAEKDKKVKGINLSRNFGQHYAITAGLDNCSGEWIIVMDCDLQDQPEEIIKLYNKSQEGYDIVLACRKIRKDKFTKKIFSFLFYSFLSYLTGLKQDPSVANFGIYSHKVINEVKKLKDSIRYFPSIIKWIGFKQTKIEINHSSRYLGETSYNFKKLLNLATDIILAYSDKPIRIIVKIGISISLLSFIYSIYIIIQHLAGNISVLGFTSIFASIWFLSGVIIMILGIVGLYIGKIFEGVKDRPLYIIDDYAN